MSDVVKSVPTRTVALTAAERDWIRRQGLTARVLADEQRRVRQALSVDGPEVTRVRERFRHDRQLDTVGAPGSGRHHSAGCRSVASGNSPLRLGSRSFAAQAFAVVPSGLMGTRAPAAGGSQASPSSGAAAEHALPFRA
jgi:hypothetical protein